MIYGLEEVVERLLENPRTDVNIIDSKVCAHLLLHALFSFVLQLGYSAFHHAAVRGDALMVHRLLGDPRVDVNLRSTKVTQP